MPGKNSSSRGALDTHHTLARGGEPLAYEDPRDTLAMRQAYPLDMEVNIKLFLNYRIQIVEGLNYRMSS